MKVLFTFYVPSGGVETLNRLRCTALKNHGIEGHLLYLQPGSGLGNTQSASIPVTVAPSDGELINLLPQYDAVVTTSDYLMPGRLRRLGFSKPIIFEIQGLGTRQQAMQTLQEGSEEIRRYCQASLMPPTPHLVELSSIYYPALPKFVFPNLLDMQHFHYKVQPKYPVPVIAWVGRLEPNKNWELFLEIAAGLIRQRPQMEIWMFLDYQLPSEETKNAFWQYVQSLGLQPKLKLYPNTPNREMPFYLSRIGDSGGMMISTSSLEGFGYAVAEALACRCPVLSTDSEGVRFFIKHNQTGRFFSFPNVGEAVSGAIEMMDHVHLREQIRSGGQQHISQWMSPLQYANSFRQMLNQLNVW
ncbi:glycosyltransferase family 4 protein [Paenibacillus macerans]|uniref:glycosyltransferase family 4 protein n=1 Tax=Paenibacillus macerans TaxID=44252 RepID=UPI003D3235DD